MFYVILQCLLKAFYEGLDFLFLPFVTILILCLKLSSQIYFYSLNFISHIFNKYLI